MARSVEPAITPLASNDLAASRRALDGRGIKYSMVNGVPVVLQGFSAPAGKQNLFEQCLEMNRQAMVRSPQSLPGRSA